MKSNKLKRIMFSASTAVLTLILIFSSIMTAFAWSDFTQSKTNAFRGTVAKTTVVLHKYEKNQNGDIIPHPVSNAEFLLSKQNSDGTWTQIGGVHVTDPSGKITVDKLNSGEYKFVETKPSYGFEFDKEVVGGVTKDVTEYEFTIEPEDAEGLAIKTVPAYNRRLQSGLEITKTVTNKDGSELTPAQLDQPFEFKVTFGYAGPYEYRIDAGSPGGIGTKQTIQSGGTLTLKHGQKAVFENLPVGLYYEVVETQNPDYIVSSSGNTGSIELNKVRKAEFTNTFGTPDPKKIKITVKKIVETMSGVLPDSEKERDFKFNLQVNGGAKQPFELKGFAPLNEMTFELDSGDTYSITEVDPFGWGYIQTSALNGMGTACEPDITVTYTNTFVGTVWVTIDGEKTWDMKGDSNAKYPNSITVELLADGVASQSTTVKSVDDKWTYKFLAPKFGEDGKEIKYTIREIPIPGFTSVVTGNNIKNTWNPDTPVVIDPPVKVTKALLGRIPTSADTYTFMLKALNGGPLPTGATGNHITMTITGAGEKDFGDIYFNTVGTFNYEITEVTGELNCTYDDNIYTMTVVVERTSEGLLAVKSVNYSNRYSKTFDNPTFINDYGTEHEPSTVIISGLKTWYHGDNPTSNQPNSITVRIMDGDREAASAVIGETEHWQWSFSLPKFREDGKTRIRYTVNEDKVDGYTKTVDGYNLINTHDSVPYIPGPNEILLQGTKIWNFKNAPQNERPEKVTIFIKNGSTVVKEITVSEMTEWKWITILPKADKDGNIIRYTVDEANVPRYTRQIDGYDIINTYVSTDYPGDSPKTGDDSNLMFWLIMALSSFVLLSITLVLGYKSKLQGKYYKPKHR